MLYGTLGSVTALYLFLWIIGTVTLLGSPLVAFPSDEIEYLIPEH
jgi:uncharacterized BrkB/YihY/UPF0761 family membrane protein